jgi:hypothetical protein
MSDLEVIVSPGNQVVVQVPSPGATIAPCTPGAALSGFPIPTCDEVVFNNNGNGDPTYIGFKKSGLTVYGLDFQYDGSGKLVRIIED